MALVMFAGSGCRKAPEAVAPATGAGRLFAVTFQTMNNPFFVDLNEGLRRVIEANGDRLVTLDTQEGKGTTEGARPVMRDLLARFPELDAAFPINDPSALGCLSAIESAGKSRQITVVSVDGSREGIAAVRAGRLHSTSAQFPAEIGRVAAEKAYAHLAGKPIEKDVKIPVQLITRENADTSPPRP